MFRRQLIKKNFWFSCENVKENYSCMFCVTVFPQINIKKNTNSSLKRPQDKGTKAGSVKKEKVVKKEEGNYVVEFCTAVIHTLISSKCLLSNFIMNAPLRFGKLSQVLVVHCGRWDSGSRQRAFRNSFSVGASTVMRSLVSLPRIRCHWCEGVHSALSPAPPLLLSEEGSVCGLALAHS